MHSHCIVCDAAIDAASALCATCRALKYINANRIANNMINVDGYTVAQMYAAVDEAREICGLDKVVHKGE